MAKAKPKSNAENTFDNEVLNVDDAVASIIKKIKFETLISLVQNCFSEIRKSTKIQENE